MNIITKFSGFILLGVLLTVPVYVNAAEKAFKPTGVVHCVYLWLADSGNDEQRSKLIAATLPLKQLPAVVDLKVGQVISSERKIVNDSFDVGVYFYFNDVAAMNAYLQHPLHKKIVQQQIKPLVSKIAVFDMYDVTF